MYTRNPFVIYRVDEKGVILYKSSSKNVYRLDKIADYIYISLNEVDKEEVIICRISKKFSLNYFEARTNFNNYIEQFKSVGFIYENN